ncbi:MAG TPA: hypothetical protein VF575_00450 [Candidatus Saccharimonadales bacterium]|jgi:hypothetical protein
MIRATFGPGNRGEINVLLLPLILLSVFFVASAGFAIWAYGGRQDYKNNTEQKIASAVKTAKQQEGIVKDKQHAEADKQPLKTYTGPDQFGSVKVSFPKTWSAYVNASGSGAQPLDGYFNPGVVPSLSDQASIFALRVQIVNQPYAAVIAGLNTAVTAKQLTATPYAFPQVPNVIGTKFDGTINQSRKITGSMIVVPLRDKTLQVWNESSVTSADFTTYILPNITFSP